MQVFLVALESLVLLKRQNQMLQDVAGCLMKPTRRKGAQQSPWPVSVLPTHLLEAQKPRCALPDKSISFLFIRNCRQHSLPHGGIFGSRNRFPRLMASQAPTASCKRHKCLILPVWHDAQALIEKVCITSVRAFYDAAPSNALSRGGMRRRMPRRRPSGVVGS